MTFRERLWPTIPVWLLAVGGAATFGLIFIYFTLPVAITVSAVAVAATVWALTRFASRIEVRDGEFCAGPAHIDCRYLRDPQPVTAAARRTMLGVKLDPQAFVLLRWWVPTMVKVSIADPADPTPYWLVSTRRPDELVAALTAAIESAG